MAQDSEGGNRKRRKRQPRKAASETRGVEGSAGARMAMAAMPGMRWLDGTATPQSVAAQAARSKYCTEVQYIIQNLQYPLLFTYQASSTTRGAKFSTKFRTKKSYKGAAPGRVI